MRTVACAALLAVATLGFAASADAGTTTGPTATPTNAAAPPPPVDQSYYAGYDIQSSTPFTSISGTWNVPVSPVVEPSSDALRVWIGLNGAAAGPSPYLLQTGSVSTGGVPINQEASNFYEILPYQTHAWGYPNYTGNPTVTPGDSLTATITNEGGTCSWSPGWASTGGQLTGVNWATTLTDNTTGQTWSQQQQCYPAAAATDAEWIVENPGGTALPWTGAINFTNLSIAGGSDLKVNKDSFIDAAGVPQTTETSFSLTSGFGVTYTPKSDPSTAPVEPTTVKITRACQHVRSRSYCSRIAGHTLKLHRGTKSITVLVRLDRAVRMHLAGITLHAPYGRVGTAQLDRRASTTSKSGTAKLTLKVTGAKQLQIDLQNSNVAYLNLRAVPEHT